ncbi:hypothetical protein KUM39_22645 [Streptomyces sp. J2-1]|uniref:hypothetical protein n=1 Tax=Streptomyces corallincola TaxID=2851888 RepID=UPI001C387C4E|nr:hypothetical protein [Streptomyces corallincola]MBV2357139.1 hypothetical protein [Streptomyces corallincola]
MDPITGAALAALAGSLGGEAGRSAWQGLTALVRRPFRRTGQEDAQLPDGLPSGEPELTALQRDPANQAHAQALATALGVRAALDAEFRARLDEWWEQTRSTSIDVVENRVTGGTQGNVVQGRDFTGLTFNIGGPPSPSGAA